MARKGAAPFEVVAEPDDGLAKVTVDSKLTGTEWGWLNIKGVLFSVPNSGGQHESVANQICALQGISDSLTMEKMGWIRVDGSDVRTSHCPKLGCMTTLQHKFLSKLLAALADAEKGSGAWEQKRELRSLLAHAYVRDLDEVCTDQGGKLVYRTKNGKRTACFAWTGWEEEDTQISG